MLKIKGFEENKLIWLSWRGIGLNLFCFISDNNLENEW